MLLAVCCLFQWIKSHCYQYGCTRYLLDTYGDRFTVEQLISWLGEIGNLPAQDAIRREYESMNIALLFHLPLLCMIMLTNVTYSSYSIIRTTYANTQLSAK